MRVQGLHARRPPTTCSRASRSRSIVFDVELIYLARRRGYRIAIVPIRWADRRGSRMRPRPGPGAARRLGPVPDPADPSRRRRARPAGSDVTAARRTRSARSAGACRSSRSLVFAVVVGATLAVAGDTLGYDFLAYHQAAQPAPRRAARSTTSTSRPAAAFGLFFYPPTVRPRRAPVRRCCRRRPAIWVWTGAADRGVRCSGSRSCRSRATVRWWIVLLAGLSWPFVYAIKLGQVGPLLFLLFAIGWRWLDDPIRLGATAAIGAAIKIQPGLVLVWALADPALARGRRGRRARPSLASSPLRRCSPGRRSGPTSSTLVAPVSDPITTPHNFTPGAVAYQLGLAAHVAAVVQLVSSVLASSWSSCVAAVRRPRRPSYLVAVVASQLLSPILWDHYAMLLLLPVAYLLAAGRWWAVAIPLATARPARSA